VSQKEVAVSRTGIGISCAILIGAFGAIGQAQAPAGGSSKVPVAIGPPPAPKRVYVGGGPDFGTQTHVWQAIPASDFDPDTACGSGCTDFATTWNPQGGVLSFRRYVTDGQPRLFASPRLPGGARLTDVEYDYCDNNGSGRLFFLVYLCDFKGHCSDPAYHTHTSTAGEGCVAVVYSDLPAYTVDNLHSRIQVEVGWNVSDDTLQLAGVSFGYTLQVSPAPPFQTFNDVPMSDPAFQYIEALVASGITAGCGNGNYCPDSALTRRQMAVFLAKALGLNWSE
jgi:hypothetical protein